MRPYKAPTKYLNDLAHIVIVVFTQLVSKHKVICPSEGPQVTAGWCWRNQSAPGPALGGIPPLQNCKNMQFST